MSLVSLLAEIYRVGEIKLNLKFEIEVLFNKLGISLKDVPIRNYLVGVNINQQSNQNFRQQLPSAAHALTPVRVLCAFSSLQVFHNLRQIISHCCLQNQIKESPHSYILDI